jgi:hypothetical protein
LHPFGEIRVCGDNQRCFLIRLHGCRRYRATQEQLPRLRVRRSDCYAATRRSSQTSSITSRCPAENSTRRLCPVGIPAKQ